MRCTTPWTAFGLMSAALFLVMGAAPADTFVEGTVLGDGEEPLAGAALQLFEEATGRERYAAVTRQDGAFVLPGVRTGTYRLVVTHLGYATHTEHLTVASEESIRLRIRLSSLAMENEEVVVVSNRARKQLTPITFTNITSRELALRPAMKDLPAHLATLPSITHYSENGNDMGYVHLRMRGFGQRRVAVSINGIPQNDPEEHNVYWINFFDLQGAIEDIQIQRGAGASFYGSTGIGGAVNIVATPYKSEPYAKFEGAVGTYSTQRITLEANSGLLNGRYIAFARYSGLTSDGYRDWSWSKFWRFFAGVTRYGRQHTLTLQAFGGPQRDGLAFAGIPKAANKGTYIDEYGIEHTRQSNPSAATKDEEWFHQPQIQLLHDWQVRPEVTLHQTLFLVRGVGHFDFGGTFRSADYLRLPDGFRNLTAEERGLPLYISAPDVQLLFRAALDQWQVGWLPRVRYSHSMGETTIGAEARLHRSLSWGRTQEATGVPSNLVGADNDVRVYSFRAEKVVTSLYGSHLLHVAERLAVQGDVQVTWRRHRLYDEAFFGNSFEVPYLFLNPRLGVTVNPGRLVSGYASVALANREPRMSSLYEGEEAGAGFLPHFSLSEAGAYNYDAPFVRPEQLLDVEIGSQVTRRRFRVAANVFWMDFRDEIVPSGGLDQFGVPRTGNAGKTRHTGLEAEMAVRLASGLDLQANGTISWNQFLHFMEYVTLPDGSIGASDRTGNPIAGFPSHMANIGLTYQRRALIVRATAMYAGTQYIDNAFGRDSAGTPRDELKVDPYMLAGLSVHYSFPIRSQLNGLSLSADVNNVLNQRVLLFGNVGFGTPQFFPAATRHMMFTLRYVIDPARR